MNFLYSPKTRTLHDIINKSQQHKLPCISISVGGIRRNRNRVFNKIDGSWWANFTSNTPQGAVWNNFLQPVPIDITVNVSIISRFQSDIDQIITNFIPYTDPYFVISWKWPGFESTGDFEIRSAVLWSENVNISYPQDIGATSPYWIVADTSFTIESWLFKNKAADGAPIHIIDCSFSSVSGMDYNVMKITEENPYTSIKTISAQPQINNIEPYYSYIGSDIISPLKTFKLYGKMLDYTNNIYISSYNWDMFDYASGGDFSTEGPILISSYDKFPSIHGIELLSSKWEIINDNFIEFTFSPLQTGIFDVIVANSAGYSILSYDSVRTVLNPYKKDTHEYDNYVEYQYPCISGVEIRSI